MLASGMLGVTQVVSANFGNGNLVARLQAMPQFVGNFDTMYDQNRDWRNCLKGLLSYAEENNVRFANLVTPENSPHNSPGRGGAGNGGGAVAGAQGGGAQAGNQS